MARFQMLLPIAICMLVYGKEEDKEEDKEEKKEEKKVTWITLSLYLTT